MNIKSKLNKQNIFALGIMSALSVVLFCILSFYYASSMEQMTCGRFTYSITGLFSLLTFAGSACVIFSTKRKEPLFVAFITFAIGAALTARFTMLDFISQDYEDCLSIWISVFKYHPGVSGWSKTVGDYNMPYLYLLTLIAKLPFIPLYLIKTLSVTFDLILAFFIMKIAEIKIKSSETLAAIFIGMLFVPTVIINSAYWAQCDVIYATFCIAFLYFALKEKSALSVIMLSVAFSFKLQTVFIMPMLIVFLFMKKIRVRDLIWFPIVFFALLIPALVAGKPFMDAISVYYEQAKSYPFLEIHAPNVYQLFEHADYDTFVSAGIIFAGTAAAALLYYAYRNKKYFDTSLFILLSFLFALTIPMLLPKMHERYFFLADILAVLVFLYNKKRWFVPVGIIYGSFRSYTVFLGKTPFRDEIEQITDVGAQEAYAEALANIDMRILAIIFIAVNIFCVYDLVREINARKAADSIE